MLLAEYVWRSQWLNRLSGLHLGQMGQQACKTFCAHKQSAKIFVPCLSLRSSVYAKGGGRRAEDEQDTEPRLSHPNTCPNLHPHPKAGV